MACYDKGRRFFSSRFVLFAMARPLGGPSRLGMAVSRKVGCAVKRNRLKRLVREWFRRNRAELPSGLDFVIVPKRGLDISSLNLETVSQELSPLLARAFRKMEADLAGSGKHEQGGVRRHETPDPHRP